MTSFSSKVKLKKTNIFYIFGRNGELHPTRLMPNQKFQIYEIETSVWRESMEKITLNVSVPYCTELFPLKHFKSTILVLNTAT